MAKCTYCSSTILFGGKRDANGRFCNQKCQGRGALLALSQQIPESVVKDQVWKIHQGLCPKCSGSGPVDVHTSHRVWSAVFLTSWSSAPELSCRKCGMKSQAIGAAFSLALGWWGFPWGFIVTPIQIVKNGVAMARPPEALNPSPLLERVVRMNMAAQAVRQNSAQAPPAPVA